MYSSVDVLLSWFHILAIVNSAVIIMDMQVYLWHADLEFFST